MSEFVVSVTLNPDGTIAQTTPQLAMAFERGLTINGVPGPPGQGVPTGGSSAQALVKQSSTNYDTVWHTLVASDVGADQSGLAAAALSAALAASLAKSSNLSDVASPSTALTNIGGVPTSRQVTPADATLTGGGTLAADRTLGVNYGATLTAETSALDVRPQEARQDLPRLGGTVGAAAAVTSALQYDGALGDSLARELGASVFGQTGWLSRLNYKENRLLGAVDPGPGLVMPFMSVAFYGTLQWNNASAGIASTLGPSNVGGSSPASACNLNGNGHVITDNRTFRRALIIYAKQASNAATFQYATDGGTTYNGSDISTTGTGYGVVLTPDLGTITGTLAIKQTSAASAGAVIVGYVPIQTAGTSGSVMLNMSSGGNLTTDLLTNQGWRNVLRALVSNGTPMRRIYLSNGGDDILLNDTGLSTVEGNLETIIGQIQTDSPLTEVVLVAPYYLSDTHDGVTNPYSRAQWVSTVIPQVWEKAAIVKGCTLVNFYQALQDLSDKPGGDPYGLTVEHLHCHDTGQLAMANYAAEHLTFAAFPASLPSTLGAYVPFTPAAGVATEIIGIPNSTDTFVWTSAFGVAVVGLLRSGDTNARVSLSGLGATLYGDGTIAPVGISLGDSTHLTLGSLLLQSATNPAAANDLVRLGYLATVAHSGSAADLGTGTLPAGRMPALTGGVTSSAGSTATVVASAPLSALQSVASSGSATWTLDSATNARFSVVDVLGAATIVGFFKNGTDAQACLAWSSSSSEAWIAGNGTASPTAASFASQYSLDQMASAAGSYSMGGHDVTGLPTAVAAVATSGSATPKAFVDESIYGNGSDGAVTISVNTTLTRDMHYTDLTVNSAVFLHTAGFRVFVRGRLISGSSSATIDNVGAAGGATGSAGAGAGAGYLSGGTNGGSGSTTTGGNGTAAGTTAQLGAAGGNGGAGTSAAGTAGTASAVTAASLGSTAAASYDPLTLRMGIASADGATTLRRFQGGAGGGAGGGDGTNKGGGGGGGGGVVLIFARDASAWAGTISVAGGAGGSTTLGNTGGGGGGGGGFIGLVTNVAPTGSPTYTVSGGAAGTKTGTGSNGSAGSNGTSQVYTLT